MVDGAEGTYNPGPRKFNFHVKTQERDPKVVTIVDDGRARQVEIR
jgi:hypothetical protein